MRYVSNWYSLLALFANLIPKTTVKFRDGKKITIYKREENKVLELREGYGLQDHGVTWLQNSRNFVEFFEEIYVRYLKDHGFYYQTDGSTIVTIPGGIKLKIIRPYSVVIDEIFLSRVYGIHNLAGRTVIDIGASIGDSSLYFASLGAKRVYAFELDKERYKLAVENIALNKMEEKISVVNEAATSSTIQSLILENDLENIFIKIDCEGCEYEIFHNLDSGLLERAKDIVLEFHGNVDPLVKRLEDQGFLLRKKNSLLFGSRKMQ